MAKEENIKNIDIKALIDGTGHFEGPLIKFLYPTAGRYNPLKERLVQLVTANSEYLEGIELIRKKKLPVERKYKRFLQEKIVGMQIVGYNTDITD